MLVRGELMSHMCWKTADMKQLFVITSVSHLSRIPIRSPSHYLPLILPIPYSHSDCQPVSISSLSFPHVLPPVSSPVLPLYHILRFTSPFQFSVPFLRLNSMSFPWPLSQYPSPASPSAYPISGSGDLTSERVPMVSKKSPTQQMAAL